MITQSLISSLSLIREIAQPSCEEDMFRNSDIKWDRKKLGLNDEAEQLAIDIVKSAAESLPDFDFVVPF